jgi:Tol biopolymer transport system component
VIIRTDGTGERVLTTDALSSPSWSPDGRIAFRRASTGGIWTMRADGSELASLNTLVGDNLPTWSPDGSRLLLWSLTSDGREGFVVINADGSNRHDVAPAEGGAVAESPTWSPDGTWILFARHWVSTSDSPRGCALYQVPADGGTPLVVLPEKPSTECLGASWR